MERRLIAAANWFAEQLDRHFSGHIDVLFTSEAMNLASLYMLAPDLAARPSVVYFHENQLPPPNLEFDGPLDLVNLNTATAASEVWFNSTFHLKRFLTRGSALVARHRELASHNPMGAITGKARLVTPPLDLGYVGSVRSAYSQPAREPGTIFVETRDADVDFLNTALDLLQRSGRKFRLITVGPVKQLATNWERTTIREIDEPAQVLGMMQSTVLLSVKPTATSDYLCVRGMLSGCRPVVPGDGVYPELIPQSLHALALYRDEPADCARMLDDALEFGDWSGHSPDWRKVFRPFDAISACRTIDERLEELSESRSAAG